MPNASHRRTRPQQRGIALIEALVGMLIFAFGVLGLIGLQASMTRAQTSAHYRADASNLASELFGLIQTDAAGSIANYDSANCGNSKRCTDWLRRVAATLPSGQATVAAAASGAVTVTVSWAQGSDRNSFTSTMNWHP